MKLIRTVAPAAALLFAAGLYAQTAPPGGPTTGGTVPPPTAPGAGGKVPGSKPMVEFPTDPPKSTTPTDSGTGMFPTQVFQITGVPRALNVTDRQQAQLDTFTQQLQARFQAQYDRLTGLPAAEREARLAQLNRDYTASWIDGARGVFQPEQLTRYQQLQLQYGGFAALTDPVAQKALNLTDAQVNRLQADLSWSEQQRLAIQQQAAIDQARALQMFNEFNTTSQTRFNQLLTPAQQQSWSQLAGESFTFPPPFPVAPAGTGTGTTPGTGTPMGTGPGSVTGPGGRPVPPGAGQTPAPRPGAPGPTTGGTAPKGGPTTGGTAPPGGPTTGGTAPPGGPTTGGTAPGTRPGGTPPKM